MEEQKEYGINVNRSSEHLGDCLELMQYIPDKSIDAIICDLPYGTTQCKWDSVIPFEPLWKQYKRIIRDNGAIVLFGSEPFSSALRMSNIKNYRYDWIWEKSHPTGFALSKKRPLKYHEDICVFYLKQPNYNPQMWQGKPNHGDKRYLKSLNNNSKSQPNLKSVKAKKDGLKYPKDILKFNSHNRADLLHPTQKPLELLKYLVKTYTNENEIVLDNTAGSFTTAIACLETNRKYIVMEKEKEYYNKGIKRILEWKQNKAKRLF